jgi:DNA-binding LacI/PurR family transcriptional regulator
VGRKSITIRDVADQAGVSESTVSRVLSGSKTQIAIGQETRERVLQVAEELGYSPHPAARALRGKGTNLLGLIVRDIDDLFFAELIKVIGDAAKQSQYDLVLGYARDDPAEALALSEVLDLRRCDGLFLLGDLKESPQDRTFLANIGKAHLIVAVGRGSQELVHNIPSICIDNRKGAFMALSYLVRLGHRRIAFIDGGRVGDLWERTEAYREFMRERFGGVCQQHVQSDENSYEGGYRAMKKLLALSSFPTAVFAADDTMAIGALKAASDMGYAVPEDVSVIGFDDINIAAYLQPALTTIRQPIGRMGEKAVELLLEMVREKSVPATVPHLLMEPELIIRDSCAPPSRPAGS